MTDTPENPPAFPAAWSASSGMTIRDYFAAAALPSLLLGFPQEDMYGSDGEERRRVAAVHSYKMADAMLKAR